MCVSLFLHARPTAHEARVIVTDRPTYWTNPNGPRPRTAFIVVHHAAAVYPAGVAADKIYAYHAKKWPDYHAAAYHEIIERYPDGSLRCSVMNPPDLIGAGVWGRNDECYHICAATNFTSTPTDDWIDAIAEACAAALRRYPSAVIKGHKEITRPNHGTSCPGATWHEWKPVLLSRVAAILTPTARYRFRVASPAFADWDLSRLAPSDAAPGGWQAGDVVEVDGIRGNVAHAGDLGFVPKAVLERL